jgi:pyruvate/2-oxoglutarate dehydrogenase complex dihydrolipoamide acyltransferase (E2) component
MTDKATIEVPSPISGTVRELCAQVGDICAVEQLIAVIVPQAPRRSPRRRPPEVVVPAARSASSGPVLATPAARALARESGIDLAGLPIDERGRITKTDVLRAKDAAVLAAADLYAGTGPKSQPAVKPAPVIEAAPVYTAPKPEVAKPAPREARVAAGSGGARGGAGGGGRHHPVPRDAAEDRRGHGALVHDGGALHLRRAGQRDEAGQAARRGQGGRGRSRACS